MERFDHLIAGQGKFTVVFLNGFRMPFSSWDKVYPDLENHYRVVLYNRPSVGKSPKAKSVQDGLSVIQQLREFLHQQQLPAPYCLVAHSLGGIYANLFARTYADEVAAVIFVDAPHPDEIIKQRAIAPPSSLMHLNNMFKKMEKWFDPFKYSEDETIETTLEQLERAGAFPAIPIAVISGTKKMPFVPQQAFTLHQNYQQELGKLSDKSFFYACKESGHFPQITEPYIVKTAIHQTIAVIRP